MMWKMRMPAAYLILAFLISAPALTGADDKAMERLKWMRANQTGMWNVVPSEGEHLSGLVKKLNAKRVLEVGTSNGYSGLWFAIALRETGGRLVTLEIDEGRRLLALENFAAAGVAELIDSRLGDALQEIPKLAGPFDLVFLDAAKGQHVQYLNLVLPMVRTGGVIVAHNVIDLKSAMQEYLDVLENHPLLDTEIVAAGPAGFAVSVKK